MLGNWKLLERPPGWLFSNQKAIHFVFLSPCHQEMKLESLRPGSNTSTLFRTPTDKSIYAMQACISCRLVAGSISLGLSFFGLQYTQIHSTGTESLFCVVEMGCYVRDSVKLQSSRDRNSVVSTKLPLCCIVTGPVPYRHPLFRQVPDQKLIPTCPFPRRTTFHPNC